MSRGGPGLDAGTGGEGAGPFCCQALCWPQDKNMTRVLSHPQEPPKSPTDRL